jgi:hypothetical protein
MKHPESILEAARQADAAHPTSIPDAVEACLATVEQSPDFEEWCRGLVRGTCQELVYDARHRANLAMRKARRAESYSPGDGIQAPTGPGRTRRRVNAFTASAEIYRKYYEKRIWGTTLGKLRGDQLEAAALAEEARANGHAVNATICRRLRRLVPDDHTVEEVVKPEDIVRVFAECERDAA